MNTLKLGILKSHVAMGYRDLFCLDVSVTIAVKASAASPHSFGSFTRNVMSELRQTCSFVNAWEASYTNYC